MINSKLNYLYSIEIGETIQLCDKKNELKFVYLQNVFRDHIFNIYV